MSDTIVLNGLEWDKENLSVDGNIYFTYQEAKIEAAKLGKRLPTKDEFEALLKLPYIWDTNKKGLWFAERNEDLKTEKSLFFPAAGYKCDEIATIDNVDNYGLYWSDAPFRTIGAFYLFLNNPDAYTCTCGFNHGLTVLCVSDIKQ